MLPHIRGPRLAALLGASALALAGPPAAAEAAPPYAALLAQAQLSAPRLAQAGADVRQAEGLARQAGARPNPTVSVEVENFRGGGPYSGFEKAETTVSLAQPIELGGKRAARIGAARADLDAARARTAQARGDYAFDLAVAYAQAEAASLRLALAKEAAQVAREDLRIGRILVEAGRESRLRLGQLDAALAAGAADIEAARVEEVAAYAKLSALVGTEARFTLVSQSLLSQAPPARATDDDEALATPAVAAAEAERAAAARRVALERLRAVPDVTASVGVRRFSGDESSALVAGVSAPLPLFDRNRGAVSAARAGLEAADARLAAARLDALATYRTAAFQLGASGARVEAMTEAAKAADETWRLTRTGYEAGKLPLIELLAAQRARTEARTRLIESQIARVRAEADLARLQGRTPFGG